MQTLDEMKPQQSPELLKSLHILTRDGKINQDSRRKLKQVYHLYNFIEPILEKLNKENEQYSIVDHGCGKSYLGFILYDLFIKQNLGKVIGIDTREELVENAKGLAKKLKFDRMDFINSAIADAENLIDQTSDYLSKEKAIGWFQGRMEFGPRALGGRSILGDPRSDKMQKNLNLKVKYRESFRPFAPSVLKEDLSDWFDMNVSSPYMLLVADINLNKQIQMSDEQKKLFGIDKLNIKRSEIPAVTHVDYSARIQTVDKKNNKYYYDLISKFKEKTGCPVIVNTSFNVRGEPIVNTPLDAYNCFMGTELDKLVIGNFYLDKKEQDQSLIKDYKKEFELD